MKKLKFDFEMKIKLFLSLFVFITSLSSCEWNGNDEENYVELERPLESVPLSIDLVGVNPNEVIQIVNGSYVNYTIHSGGRELIQQKFYLDGVELSQSGWSTGIYIDGQRIDDKIHELKLVMTLRTNTGSLAELTGVESYIGEYIFKLKFCEKKENSQLNIRQTLNEFNYLKLEWDKPNGLEIERYEVYEGDWLGYDSLIQVINNPDETYMVDESYYYGYKMYRVKAIPRNSINISDIVNDFFVDYEVFNQDNVISKISESKISLEWENLNLYPVKYVVSFDQSDLKVVEAGINKIDFPRPYFPLGRFSSVAIYVLPLEADSKDYEDYPYTNVSISDKRVDEYSYKMNIVDVKTNSIIGLNRDGFVMHDLFKDLSATKTSNFPNDIRISDNEGDKYSCSKDRKVAIEGIEYSGGNIHIFKDYDFTQKLYTFGNIQPGNFCISDTHLFYTKKYEREIYAINMETKEIDDRKNYKEYYSYGMKLDISSDGKYLILYSQDISDSWYIIYEFKNNKLFELKHVRDRVRFALFNPQKPSQLFLHDFDNHFDIVDVASGNIVQTVENNRYLYTDPYTQNILCYTTYKDSNKGSFFSVYDPTLTKLLYQVGASVPFPFMKGEFILANNILYCGQSGIGNYYLDVSKALKDK